MPLGVIIAGAGRGERLGADTPKALVPVRGDPLIAHTCRALSALPDVAEWVVLAPPGYEAEMEAACRATLRTEAPLHVRTGGAERADSVRLGLAALSAHCDFVAVHDAARPCVPPGDLEAVVREATRTGAAILAQPCPATVKFSEDGRLVSRTVDRTHLWLAQTPQVFRTAVLTEAMAAAHAFTDEASAVEHLGHAVVLVRGSAENLKVTTPADVAVAEALLGRLEGKPCA